MTVRCRTGLRTAVQVGILVFVTGVIRAQSIQTVAGGGTDDGRPAVSYALSYPEGVVIDSNGNLFISDTLSHRIRRVDASTGRITTVAGNGTVGDRGDGGPAIQASLNTPAGLALDSTGNLYIADTANGKIRKVFAATGIIVTVAGTGVNGFSQDNIPATQSKLNFPRGVALDAGGNLFIADTNNHRVRKVVSGGNIQTIAGTGSQGFSNDTKPAITAALANPRDVAVDASGNVFIADWANYRIRKISANGIIDTVAGSGAGTATGDGGSAAQAKIEQPWAIDLDSAGNIYFAAAQRIRKVTVSTGIITRIAGTSQSGFGGDNGPAASAVLQAPGPRDVAISATGDIYIADTNNLRIRKVTASNNIISTVAGSFLFYVGDGGPAISAILRSPATLTTDAAGNLYIADTDNHRVRKVLRSTGTITTIAGNGVNDSSGDGGPATSASLKSPFDVALDSSGNIFVCDTGAAVIRKVTAAGIISTFAGGGTSSADGIQATTAILKQPIGLGMDGAGNLYIAESNNHKIRKVTAAGIISTVAGNGTAGPAVDGVQATATTLNLPLDVSIDSVGDILIADLGNQRVRRVDAAGIISTVAGNGLRGGSGDGSLATTASLNDPYRVATDQANNVYIADRGNSRIRKVTAQTKIITTIAGSPKRADGYSGDGGAATAAGLLYPLGVAVDGSGNVFVADTPSNRIRAVFPCVSIGAPLVFTPPDGAQSVALSPTLSWSVVASTYRYDIYLDTVNPPATAIATDITPASFRPTNLDPSRQYYWRVVAKGDPFCTPRATQTSAVRTFKTQGGCDAPGPLSLAVPDDGASVSASSVLLSWSSAPGASTYDLYFGSSSPPPLYRSGLNQTQLTVAPLVTATTYFWAVVARSGCDATKVASTPVRKFSVLGACMPAGSFQQTLPVNGSGGVADTVTLQWTPSSNSASYDLYFGAASQPPLFLRSLSETSQTVGGLEPGLTYSWRVVANVSCDPTKNRSTSVSTFTTSGICVRPSRTEFVFYPTASVTKGQTYVLTWSDADGLDASGTYVVERSTNPAFSPVIDAQETRFTSASFVASVVGTYYHRVRAIPDCDRSKTGDYSTARTAAVIAGAPNVIFTIQPPAVVSPLGQKLEETTTRFAIENIGDTSVQVSIGSFEISSVPFFTVVDPAGGDLRSLALDPRVPKQLEIHFSGPPFDEAGAYQGVITINAIGTSLSSPPYAYVSLRVGNSDSVTPQFVIGGVTNEFASFPPFSGNDSQRTPLSVTLRNPGTAALDLAGEVGPEVWLVPEPNWNSSPIAANAARDIRLFTRRSLARQGSSLPRYTFFTVRAKTGQSARLLVQDNDIAQLLSGRGSTLPPGAQSWIIPLAVSATSSSGARSYSTIRLTNVGGSDVRAELIFTPAGTDGFDTNNVKRAVVIVPPSDAVLLVDPIGQLFGNAVPAKGQIELRSERIGLLTVSSIIVLPTPTGGAFSFEVPIIVRGSGATLGSSHVISGFTTTSDEDSSVVLAETTGADTASGSITLFDSNGIRVGSTAFQLQRYGFFELSNVTTALGVAPILTGARLEVSVDAGSGRIASLLKITDRLTGGGRLELGRPSDVTTQSKLKPTFGVMSTERARSFVVPSVRNGQTTGSVQSYATSLVLWALRRIVTFKLTLRDPSRPPVLLTIPVQPGKSIEYLNVIEDLFQLARGTVIDGSITVDVDDAADVSARLSPTSRTYGRAVASQVLPVLPVDSESLTGADSRRTLYLDGLEQSTDPTRGLQWAVVLNEITGRPVIVNARLYEAGNRSIPIAEKDFSVGPYAQLKLDSVFAALGLDTPERRKDRSGVMAAIVATGGTGTVSVVGVSVDNRTGDTKTQTFNPVGTQRGGGTRTVTTPAGSCVPITISRQPQSATITAGQTATLSIEYTGSTAVLQWFAGQKGDKSAQVAGAQSNTLSISPLTTTSYWAEITNCAGPVQSDGASVIVESSRRRAVRH